jgi:MSHA pilin protein MshA
MPKKAFTLVELIVVITILAVLATVAFISFQWYALSARDSTRLADLNSITKVLELYNVKHWKYPNPDAQTNITYSGSTAWTQWVFGISSYSDGSSMSNVPVDPVTGLEYAYSVTAARQEYSLAAVLENPISSKLSQSTFAWTQEAQVHVKWNYNGKFLKVRKDATTYLLWVPSILTSYIDSATTLETIIQREDFVYKGYKNLPASFSGSVYNTNPIAWFNFTPVSEILFEWDITDLETNQAARVTFLNNLQANYIGTEIATENDIIELLAVDSSSSSAASNYVATALNNSLKTEIAIVEVEKKLTLEDVKEMMENAQALIHSQSLAIGNQSLSSSTVNIADGKGINNDWEFAIKFGYPFASETEWKRIIDIEEDFIYLTIADSLSATLIIYFSESPAPTSYSDPCMLYYRVATATTVPTYVLNECLSN